MPVTGVQTCALPIWGTGYKYAHDYPKHYVRQQYLPEEIADARFYEPGDNGYEKKIKAWMEYIRE